MGMDPLATTIIIDCDSSRLNWQIGCSPCLTVTRACAGGHWVSTRQRRMTSTEMLKLMGVRPQRLGKWKAVIKQRELHKIIGNAVPIGLLVAVINGMLDSVGHARN